VSWLALGNRVGAGGPLVRARGPMGSRRMPSQDSGRAVQPLFPGTMPWPGS